MAVFIGSIGITGRTFNINQKAQKEILETYVYWKGLGFPKKAFYDDLGRKYWMVDDDVLKEKVERLLDKNEKLLVWGVENNRSFLPKEKIKFIR